VFDKTGEDPASRGFTGFLRRKCMDRFRKMQDSLFNRVCERIAQLVKMNFVMLIISVCGLVVFGIYPALFAGSAWFNDEMEGKVTKKFATTFTYFKRYFWKGNVLMITTVLTGFLGFWMVFGRELSMFAYLLIMTWIIIVFLLNMYLPAVCILYPDFSFGKQLVFCTVAATTKWMATAILTAASLGLTYLLIVMPQFGMFLFMSLMPWLNMLVLKKAMRPETLLRVDEEENEKDPQAQA